MAHMLENAGVVVITFTDAENCELIGRFQRNDRQGALLETWLLTATESDPVGWDIFTEIDFSMGNPGHLSAEINSKWQGYLTCHRRLHPSKAESTEAAL